MQSVLDAAVYNQIKAYAKFNRIYLLKRERLLSCGGTAFEQTKVQSSPGKSEEIEKLVDLRKQIEKSFKTVIECLNAVAGEHQEHVLNLTLGVDFYVNDRTMLEEILSDLIEMVKIKTYGELVEYEK